MDRYARLARWYDALSVEPVYRPGRLAAIAALRLVPGARVLDVGCGTGLNFAPLQALLSPTDRPNNGEIVGLDLSAQMLAVAADKATLTTRIRLVTGDAQDLGASPLSEQVLGQAGKFDAAIFTYSLSLMPRWSAAWLGVLAMIRPGGRVAVVDMMVPTGRARLLAPLARVACWSGGSDIGAHPWTAVEADTDEVFAAQLRGGHVQVRVGSVR